MSCTCQRQLPFLFTRILTFLYKLSNQLKVCNQLQHSYRKIYILDVFDSRLFWALCTLNMINRVKKLTKIYLHTVLWKCANIMNTFRSNYLCKLWAYTSPCSVQVRPSSVQESRKRFAFSPYSPITAQEELQLNLWHNFWENIKMFKWTLSHWALNLKVLWLSWRVSRQCQHRSNRDLWWFILIALTHPSSFAY